MSKASKFLALAVAMITGDDAKAKSLKIQKKAVAGLRAQIAVKEAKTLTLEDNVESAQEGLEKARVNDGQLISNSDDYIMNLMTANGILEIQENTLKSHEDVVAFLKGELAIVSS